MVGRARGERGQLLADRRRCRHRERPRRRRRPVGDRRPEVEAVGGRLAARIDRAGDRGRRRTGTVGRDSGRRVEARCRRTRRPASPAPRAGRRAGIECAPRAGTLKARCACIAITRRRRRSATRPGGRWSRSCGSASATPPSRTPRAARRAPDWTPPAPRSPRPRCVRAARRLHRRWLGGRQPGRARSPRARHRGRVVTTMLEHPAVALALSSTDAELAFAPVRPDGVVDRSALEQLVRPGDRLCTIIWASNLTGAIQPVREIAELCAERGVPLHVDAVQAAAWLPLAARRAARRGDGCDRRAQAARAEGSRSPRGPRRRHARPGAARGRPGARAATGHRERRAGLRARGCTRPARRRLGDRGRHRSAARSLRGQLFGPSFRTSRSQPRAPRACPDTASR